VQYPGEIGALAHIVSYWLTPCMGLTTFSAHIHTNPALDITIYNITCGGSPKQSDKDGLGSLWQHGNFNIS